MTQLSLLDPADPGLGGSPAGAHASRGVPGTEARDTTPPALTVIAHGQPAPQGSKTPHINRRTGRPGMHEDNPATKPWRETVSWAVRAAMAAAGQTEPLTGPLRVEAVFTMRKPDSAPKRRRTWPTSKPDIDKLCRAGLDSAKAAGAIRDDALVVDLHATKTFPDEHEHALPAPGLHMQIWQVTEC